MVEPCASELTRRQIMAGHMGLSCYTMASTRFQIEYSRHSVFYYNWARRSWKYRRYKFEWRFKLSVYTPRSSHCIKRRNFGSLLICIMILLLLCGYFKAIVTNITFHNCSGPKAFAQHLIIQQFVDKNDKGFCGTCMGVWIFPWEHF